MYVSSIEIENFRTIARQSLSFCSPVDAPLATAGALPNVTLLLGDNGIGKTSVLRAVALASMAPVIVEGSGWVPYSLVRRHDGVTASRSRLKVQLALGAQDGFSKPARNSHTVKLSPRSGFFDRATLAPAAWSRGMFDDKSPAFLMVGYGATRRVEKAKGFDPTATAKQLGLRYQRVAGLFEEHVTLVPLGAWLPELRHANPGRHKQVVNLINRLLPGAELLPEPLDGEYLFRMHGANLPFSALSDGYRGYLGWLADLLFHLCMGCPKGQKLVENQGVVLVDEIDLHLHPEWQRKVVRQLSATLPAIQFILTSHSPLVAGTLSCANVRVLHAEEGADGVPATAIRLPDEELYGQTSDQILTSDFFGLDSTRDPDFFEHLRGVAAKARKGDPEEALRYLRLASRGAGAFEPDPPAGPAAGARRGKKGGVAK